MLAVALAIAMLFAFLSFQQWRAGRAARAAIEHAESERQQAERRVDAARRVKEASDSAAEVRIRELADARAQALREAATARRTSYELRARLAELVPDSVAPTLDSLNVAHGSELAALQEVVAAQDTTISLLRGQIVTRDSLISRLSVQLTATERVAELWKQQANAPKGIRIGATEIAVVGGLVAAVLVLK